jgi:NADPH-dependent 2,4-dienoyl-CoA reductase/sulfur reductase-like enzyme
LENNGIIVLRESTVTGIDYAKKSVSIEGKDALSYDKLLIASGVRNRIPNIQGLSSVKYYSLRNKQDYLNIYEALSKAPNKNVTIIGGGFIGMELASAIKLAYKDANVTVL